MKILRRAIWVFSILVISGVGTVAPIEVAEGHAWTDLYCCDENSEPARWNTSDLPVRWLLTLDWGLSCSAQMCTYVTDWHTRAVKAADAWNALGRNFQFTFEGQAGHNWSWESTDANCNSTSVGSTGDLNGLHYSADIQPPIIAATTRCYIDSARTRIRTFQIVVSKNVLWWVGPPTSGSYWIPDDYPPNDRYDLQAFVTHEFGHATGWGDRHMGDLESKGACSKDNNSRQTMCREEDPGIARIRTLEDHDRHTFINAYPTGKIEPPDYACPNGCRLPI